MSDELKYQVRIDLSAEHAPLVRSNPGDPALAPLMNILRKHSTTIKSQYDAFADYVAEAERQGVEHFPLYKWTKATIENEEKKAKYLKSFTLYANDEEVYDKNVADSLEADLAPLVGAGVVTRLAKHDTNPANNPQMPERYR